MENWYTSSLETIQGKSKNITKLLNLNLLNEILDTMKNKSKYRCIQNSPLAYIKAEARDKALGMLIQNPGIMTRRYNNFIDTSLVKKCPYCNEDTGQLIFHMFKCKELYGGIDVGR